MKNKKEFRIVESDIAHCFKSNPLVLPYKIEQRHHLLWLLHWWGTPNFTPPHYFKTKHDAAKFIQDRYPSATIYEVKQTLNYGLQRKV